MEFPQDRPSLSALIADLKTRDNIQGSLGESPASLLAYMEQLERRIARLEEHERDRKR